MQPFDDNRGLDRTRDRDRERDRARDRERERERDSNSSQIKSQHRERETERDREWARERNREWERERPHKQPRGNERDHWDRNFDRRKWSDFREREMSDSDEDRFGRSRSHCLRRSPSPPSQRRSPPPPPPTLPPHSPNEAESLQIKNDILHEKNKRFFDENNTKQWFIDRFHPDKLVARYKQNAEAAVNRASIFHNGAPPDVASDPTGPTFSLQNTSHIFIPEVPETITLQDVAKMFQGCNGFLKVHGGGENSNCVFVFFDCDYNCKKAVANKAGSQLKGIVLPLFAKTVSPTVKLPIIASTLPELHSHLVLAREIIAKLDQDATISENQLLKIPIPELPLPPPQQPLQPLQPQPQPQLEQEQNPQQNGKPNQTPATLEEQPTNEKDSQPTPTQLTEQSTTTTTKTATKTTTTTTTTITTEETNHEETNPSQEPVATTKTENDSNSRENSSAVENGNHTDEPKGNEGMEIELNDAKPKGLLPLPGVAVAQVPPHPNKGLLPRPALQLATQKIQDQLDSCVSYLACVHLFSFFAVRHYEVVADMIAAPVWERIPLDPLRNSVPILPTDQIWAEDIKSKLRSRLEQPSMVEDLMSKLSEKLQLWLNSKTETIEQDRFKCRECNKMFKAPNFVHKHLKLRHVELIAEAKARAVEEVFYDNFATSELSAINELPPHHIGMPLPQLPMPLHFPPPPLGVPFPLIPVGSLPPHPPLIPLGPVPLEPPMLSTGPPPRRYHDLDAQAKQDDGVGEIDYGF